MIPKKDSLRFNNFLLQSPKLELPEIEKNTQDPLTKTFREKINEQGVGAFYIRLYEVDINKISTSNPTAKRIAQHGTTLGIGTEIIRNIRIRGEIIANDQLGKDKAIDFIRRVYTLSDNPSIISRGIYKLEFEDQENVKWFLFAQISRNLPEIEFSEGQHNISNFTVNLIAEDLNIYSDEVFFEEITEGWIGGIGIGERAQQPLGIQKLSAYENPKIINYDGSLAPTKITITTSKTSTNPQIQNGSTEIIIFSKINGILEPNQTLIFNKFSDSITINGQDVSEKEADGSSFLNLISGENILVLKDDTHPALDGNNLKGIIEFRKIKK